jgi:hypothetical protein
MSNANNKAKASIKGLSFVPAPKFSDAEAAFGADEKAFFKRRDLPDVPRKYADMANEFFFHGGKVPEFLPVVNRIDAMRALNAWLRSFAPSHESKETTVAYALWAWIEGIEEAEVAQS